MTQSRKSLFRPLTKPGSSAMTLEQRVAGVELHSDYALVPCAGSCGHGEFHRVSLKPRTHELVCSALCPGFRVHKTCVHVEAAAIAAGNSLLTIEGELSDFYKSVLDAAIADLCVGARELRKGYLWLVWRSIETPHVHTTRYGYAPDCERPDVKIGLRFPDVSEFERAACMHYLASSLSRIQQQVA